MDKKLTYKELEKTKNALEEALIRYRTLFETANDAILLQKKELYFDCNRKAVELFGGTYDQIIGSTPWDLSPEYQPDGILSRVKANNLVELAEKGIPQIFEWRHCKFDGTLFDSEVSLNKIELNGEVIIQGINRNITQRKQMENELEERMRFEKWISDLSARFINLPATEVDKSINDGLSILGNFFKVDRSFIFQFSKDRHDSRNYGWFGNNIEPDWEFLGIAFDKKFPVVTDRLLQKEPLLVTKVEDFPDKAKQARNYFLGIGIKSSVLIPLTVSGKVKGALVLDDLHSERSWPPEVVPRLQSAGDILINALTRKQAELELQEAYHAIKELKDRLLRENIYLQEEIKLKHFSEEIVGQSPDFKKILKQIEQVAQTNATVLLLGETGTGKELLARAIHDLSKHKGRPMIKVNCAAIPGTLMESELFGHEKGAYTGALSKQVGRFEVAHGSTIFLDEISELPLELQSKLLRVLQEGQFERLGSARTITVDVRVIAATNRDLTKAVQEGTFREDLYYRLNVFPILVPPLREREEDIPLLAWVFIREFEKTYGKKIETISEDSMKAMLHYSWPGNIRELRNVIEQAMIVSTGPTLRLSLPKIVPAPQKNIGKKLEDVEKSHILAVLEQSNWRVRGKGGAAEILGLKPSTLEARMAKLGIKRKK